MGYPRTLQNFNVFLDGGSLAGVAKEVTLPKLTVKTIDHIAAGMSAPVALPVGSFEALTLSMTVAEATKQMLTGIGTVMPVRFVGALLDGSASLGALEVYVRGPLTEADMGTAKREAGLDTKLDMKGLHYYRLSLDSEVLVEIDAFGSATIGSSTLGRDLLRMVGINIS
ncbi:phage major tail tube protein [Novispirillum itersonii]|uniref:phage major tail tube protein n=1 Tax=Novispirillum itersonii TaxID=189 RepID=UPI00036F518E|nr:phage major tail tube protein [Novispirillum itersonii]